MSLPRGPARIQDFPGYGTPDLLIQSEDNESGSGGVTLQNALRGAWKHTGRSRVRMGRRENSIEGMTERDKKIQQERSYGSQTEQNSAAYAFQL